MVCASFKVDPTTHIYIYAIIFFPNVDSGKLSCLVKHVLLAFQKKCKFVFMITKEASPNLPYCTVLQDFVHHVSHKYNYI